METTPRSVPAVDLPGPFDLRGRQALVTGAGSPDGIGMAVARLLGELGASITITATTGRVQERAAELASAGIESRWVIADLTDPQQADQVVSEAARDGLHIVVNNAGMTSVAHPGASERGDTAAMSSEAWRYGMARNLDTAFHVTRAALPHLIAAGWGRIVMVASVTGPVMVMRHEAVYAAAKAAMVGLTRSIALDYAASGVTCNAVAPGWIATGSALPEERAEGRHTPAGRCGTAEDVAAAVAWLATPGAAYTTGQVLVVDGGGSIAEERLPQM